MHTIDLGVIKRVLSILKSYKNKFKKIFTQFYKQKNPHKIHLIKKQKNQKQRTNSGLKYN